MSEITERRSYKYDPDYVVAKLDEISRKMDEALEKIDGKQTDFDKRLREVEMFKASIENNKPGGGQSDKLLQIVFIVLGLLGTAFGIIGSGVLSK